MTEPVIFDYPIDDPRFTKWNLLPPLDDVAYCGLKESIKEGTFTGRIVFDQEGNLLDGHAAYQAFKESKKKPGRNQIILIRVETEDEARRLIRIWNFFRRHLSQDQKRQLIADELKRCEGEKSNREIGRLLNVDHKTVIDERTKLENSEEIACIEFKGGRGKKTGLVVAYANHASHAKQLLPFLLRTDKPGKYTGRSLRDGAARENRQRLKQLGENLADPENITLIHSDFRNLEITPESVDLCCIDPPWQSDWLPNYEDLVPLIKKWLKPEGRLAIWPGRVNEDKINDLLRQHLTKVWNCSVWKKGKAVCLGRFREQSNPVMVFTREPISDEQWKKGCTFGMIDSIQCDLENKDYHPWQRTEKEVEYFVQALSRPGQLVLDCFMGGATTAAICYKLGRKCISCDIEENNVKIGRARLNEV